MLTHSPRFRHVILLCAAMTAAAAAGAALADPPADTVRYFGELTGGPCAAWEAADSKRIVAHQNGRQDDVIQFGSPTPGGFGPWFNSHFIVVDADDNVLLDLRDTVWTRMPVMHVMDGGAEHVEHVYWLEEDFDSDGDTDPPAAGTTAATGPDGDVIQFLELRVDVADSTDPYGNAGRFYLRSNGSLRFCVAIGSFQK